jgi:hypothetical protein
MEHVLAVLGLAGLCGAWVLLQAAVRRADPGQPGVEGCKSCRHADHCDRV